jgi:uncharacterized membrane protein HdeD (DUF308 family)
MVDGAIAPAPALQAMRWAAPLLGVLSIVAGIIMLVRPHGSIETLAVVVGIFMLFDSIFELATSLSRDSEARGFAAIVGVLGIVAGILLIRHPLESVTAVALIIGIWLTGVGALRLASGLVGARSTARVVLGLVEMVAGIVLVASPGIGVTTLALLAGLSFLLNGVVLLGAGRLAREVTS